MRLLRRAEERVPEVVVLGDPLAPDGAADGVIAKDVADPLALQGRAPALRLEDREAEAVLDAEEELTRPEVEAERLARESV